jgi:hypothetical protein
MKIWFHGTHEANAQRIMINGFNAGTFFAAHLEDAIAFGGPHVFEVALNRREDCWQIVVADRVPQEQIVAYQIFTRSVAYDNPELRKAVLEENHDGSLSGLAGKI